MLRAGAPRSARDPELRLAATSVAEGQLNEPRRASRVVLETGRAPTRHNAFVGPWTAHAQGGLTARLPRRPAPAGGL